MDRRQFLGKAGRGLAGLVGASMLAGTLIPTACTVAYRYQDGFIQYCNENFQPQEILTRKQLDKVKQTKDVDKAINKAYADLYKKMRRRHYLVDLNNLSAEESEWLAAQDKKEIYNALRKETGSDKRMKFIMLLCGNFTNQLTDRDVIFLRRQIAPYYGALAEVHSILSR